MTAAGGSMTTPFRIDGADISRFQPGDIDWQRAKRAGVKFCWLKGTEGTSIKDPLYARRRRELAAFGIPAGAYSFVHPGSSSGTAQARYLLDYAQLEPGDLRPALDLEKRDGLSRTALTRWVGAFVGEVERQVGALPVIYTSDRFPLDDNFGCLLWVPRYSNANAAPKVPAPWTRWHVWQASNGAFGVPNAIPGIGPCDINTLGDGVTVADLIIPSIQEDEMPTAEEIALAVKAELMKDDFRQYLINAKLRPNTEGRNETVREALRQLVDDDQEADPPA